MQSASGALAVVRVLPVSRVRMQARMTLIPAVPAQEMVVWNDASV